MRKPRYDEAKLARLKELRKGASSEDIIREVRAALLDSWNMVVAAAAEVAAERRLAELAPEMLAAFERMLEDPVKTDKTCAGKFAIAEALNKLEFHDAGMFLRGARHVQPEPIWGGTQDTAAPLRATCTDALVRLRHPDVPYLLVELLTDPDKTARVAAARILESTGTKAAMQLLRLKARLGDAEPEVTGECLSALMRAEPIESTPFVAGFLEHKETAIVEGALLALGESRRAEALPALKAFWQRSPSEELRETALLALALLRLPAATDVLLSLVAEAPQSSAAAALAALAVQRHDPALRERVAALVESRNDHGLRDVLAKSFACEERCTRGG